MIQILQILLCFPTLVNLYWVSYMPPDEQILTYDILIDENDDFIIGKSLNSQINNNFAFTYGVWSRYNPLSQITQIGKIGIFDTSCFHIHSVMKKTNFNFLYYDCLDEVNKQITKNIQFRDNIGMDHSFILQIQTDQYESNWYFFSIIIWPHKSMLKMFVMHEENAIFFEEMKIKFPYFEKSLTLNLGGGADGFYFSEQIQFSYFPGKLYAFTPNYKEYDPSTYSAWTFSPESSCTPSLDQTIINYNSFEYTDVRVQSTDNKNKNYFKLVGWIKIVQIIQVDKEFNYKILKMTTKSRNSRLTDDNLSPFCLYYYISDTGNQIIFTTYSYTFPSINFDFTTNSYLIKEAIQISDSLSAWQYVSVELKNNQLSVTITFYNEFHSIYKKNIFVVQFKEIVFEFQIGNVLQRKDNYLNFIVSQIKFSNCDSVSFFEACDNSCLECDGPTYQDCLSCSIESNRYYVANLKQCDCHYYAQDNIQCQTHQDLNFNIVQRSENKKLDCPYGYFKTIDNNCIQCPSIINSQQITCLECLTNPETWINMLQCSSSLISYNGSTFQQIIESTQYFIFDGVELNYCQSCVEKCLDDQCNFQNFYAAYSSNVMFCSSLNNPNCYKCNFERCLICGLLNQQFICLKCFNLYEFKNGKCQLSFLLGQKCFKNCANCSYKKCTFCYLPYFLTSDKKECQLCSIPNCLYCFEFQINDRKISTLQKDFSPFDHDENTRRGCSMCFEGFNYDFQLEKCVQNVPKLQNCLRSYTEFSGEEVCLLSGVNDFNIAPQIINCQQYIHNCEQCLLTTSQIMQCIVCKEGYSASFMTGQCDLCEIEHAVLCLDGTLKHDYWVQLIQSFLISFLPDSYVYGFISALSIQITFALSCQDGYRLNSKAECFKDCNSDCLSCVETNSGVTYFQCKKCPLNYYGLPTLSADKGNCLICPQLCLICILRSDDQISLINPFFRKTVYNEKYSYQCLQAVPEEKVIIDPKTQIAMYCFDDDCNNSFELKVSIEELSDLANFLDLFYETTIDTDYCNKMGIQSFQLTILLKTNYFDDEFTQFSISLKQAIFSLQNTRIIFFGDVEPGTIVSSTFIFVQFDYVKWQNIEYIAKPGMTITLQNNDQPIDVTFIDSIFTGTSKNLTFIQNGNFRNLRMKNITFKNLYFKHVTWLEFKTNYEQAIIFIEDLVIQNCTFDNVTIFNILKYQGLIQINNLRIIGSEFWITTFLLFNQTIVFSGSLIIYNIFIRDCSFYSSNLIIQMNTQLLKIHNLSMENSKLNNSFFILTNSNAILESLKIDSILFVQTQFFRVLIQTSMAKQINYKNYDFQIIKSQFTDSILFYIHSVNTEKQEININFTSIKHSQLNSTQSKEILFLYDLQCSMLITKEIGISDTFNLSYFNIYQTQQILMTGIIYKNQRQEFKIQAFQNCIQNPRVISTLLRIQGFFQVYLNNLTITNQYSVDHSPIQIFSDQLFYKNDYEIIDIKSVSFFGNILIKSNLRNIFSLLVIYSDLFLTINLKDLFFEENFFNQIVDDPSKYAAGLIFVQSQLSIINMESINCLSNGLTNSTYSFMMINSLKQTYKNFNVSHSNVLSELIWNKYYSIQSQYSTHEISNITSGLIQQIFTFSNIGGVCSMIISQLNIDNAQFQNIQAQSRSIFDITTQGQGNIILTNIKMQNISADLKSNNPAEGCVTISSQSSNLNLQAQNLLFIQIYNRLDSAIFTIFPSKKLNQISISHVEAIDCFSLLNQFVFVQFAKESESYLYIKSLVIKNSEAGLLNYFQQILFPNPIESSKITSENALIYVQNGNFQCTDVFINGIYLSQLFLLSGYKVASLVNILLLDISMLHSIGLAKFQQISELNSTLSMQNIKIVNVMQIFQINTTLLNSQDNLFILENFYNCEFSIFFKVSNTNQLINDLINFLTDDGVLGSLISIISQSETMLKISNIFLSNNTCNFCKNGLILISQNKQSSVLINEFICYKNTILQFGCLTLKTTGLFKQKYFTIKNSYFFGNQGSEGVGIYSQNVPIKVKQSLFFKNNASDRGGALFLQNSQNDFIIQKCLIFENSALIGGGLYLMGSNQLSLTNFQSSLTILNTAKLCSNNLVETPDHLALKINNMEMISIQSNVSNSDRLNLQILNLYPYQLVKGKSQFSTNIYLPRGQQIKNYMLFDIKQRIFLKYINHFSLSFKNSLNEDLIGQDSDECLIFTNLGIESSEYQFTTTQNTRNIVPFDTSNNYFDLMDLKVIPKTYRQDDLIFISINCTSISETKELWYQINAKMFNCQQGEFFTNNECQVCEPIYGFYSVTINATQCSIFDETKFQSITSNQIQLNKGYWRPKFTSNNVEFCSKTQQLCVGGWGVGNNLCFPGYIGGLCEECDIYNIQGNGYYAQSGTNECSICSQTFYQYIPAIFLIIWSFISMLLSLKSSQQTSKTFARLRATTPLYEILFKLSQDFENILLKMFLNYIWIFSVIFTFNISFDFSLNVVDSISTPSASVATNLDCLLSQASNLELIYLRIIFMITFILLQLMIVTGGIKIISILTSSNFDLSLITNSALYLFVTNQATLIKNLSSLLAVRSISDIQFVQGNTAILYYEEIHQKWIFSFILPGIIIIGIVVPLVQLFLLICFKNQSNQVKFTMHFGYLFNDYNQYNQFWEQVRILVRTTIIIFLTSFETSIYLKACLICLTLFLYQIFAQIRKPYAINGLNLLDIQSGQIVLVSIFLAIIKFICEQNNNVSASIFLQIFIIILLIGLCLSYILRIISIYLAKYQITVLQIIINICSILCIRAFFALYFKQKLNQLLLKKKRVFSNYQKLRSFINKNKLKSKNQNSFRFSKTQDTQRIQLLTLNRQKL